MNGLDIVMNILVRIAALGNFTVGIWRHDTFFIAMAAALWAMNAGQGVSRLEAEDD